MENKVEKEIFDEISEEDLPDIALDENMGANSQYVYMHKHIEKESDIK